MLPVTSGHAFSRQTSLSRLADEHFDVVVVGGGITGAGCALDAAARGLSVALVEKDDFASGTSSKSSKLIHGGLRYLQQRRVVLVYEALAERQRLLRNASHLVSILPFLIPVFHFDGIINPKAARAMGTALWAYDLTGGFRIGKKHKRVSKEASLELFPTLPDDRLEHGYIYYDCQADDARLTLAVLRTAAVNFDVAAANRVSVTGLRKNHFGRCQGVNVTTAEGESFDISCSVVLNATGVWADELRLQDDPQADRQLRPAKGIHLALPRGVFDNDAAAVVPVSQDDRSIFVIPWGDTTYLGTTDTDYDGKLDDPACTLADVEYLLRAARDNTTAKPAVEDVLGVWAGLRPLVKQAKSHSTADLSRRHRASVSESGVVTIVGGKLTTYRKMAADAVDEAIGFLDSHGAAHTDTQLGNSPTVHLSLLGAPEALEVDPAAPVTPRPPVTAPMKQLFSSRRAAKSRGGEAVLDEPGLAEPVMEHLFARYGTETSDLLDLMAENPNWAEPMHPHLPYLKAEAVYAARYEMATTLDDVLSRRLRATLLNAPAACEVANDVAGLVAGELGWQPAQAHDQADRFCQRTRHELFGWRN